MSMTASEAADPLYGKDQTAVMASNSDESAEIRLSEPATLNSDLLKNLFSETDTKITLEIPSTELENMIRNESSRPTDILLNSLVSLKPAGSESSAPNPAVFLPRTDNSIITIDIKQFVAEIENEDDAFIKIETGKQGARPQPEYVKLSSLVEMIGKYPDPIKLELPILKDVDNNNYDKVTKSNQSFKTSFAFDFRQMTRPIIAGGSDKIHGVLVFSGKGPDFAKPSAENTNIKPVGPLISEKSVSSDAQAPIQRQSTTNSQSLAAREALDMLNSPAVSRKTSNMITNAGGRELSSEFQPVQKTQPGPETSAAQSPVTNEVPDTVRGFSVGRENAALNNIGNMNPNIPVTTSERLLDIEEIKSAVLFAAKRNQSTITLKLQPEELGNLDIKLTVKHGIISADLKVENMDAYRALNGRLDELKAGLENYSLKIHEINVIHESNLNGNHTGSDQFSRGAAMWQGNGRNSSRFKDHEPSTNNNEDKTSGFKKSSQPRIHRGWVDLKA